MCTRIALTVTSEVICSLKLLALQEQSSLRRRDLLLPRPLREYARNQDGVRQLLSCSVRGERSRAPESDVAGIHEHFGAEKDRGHV